MRNIYRLKGNTYIVSHTEKIKENTQTFNEGFNGDWYFNTVHNFIAKTGDITRFDFKIIMSDDTTLIADGVQHLPDDFLEYFTNNPTCEFVEVKKGFEDGSAYGYNFLDYKIIIPKTTQEIIDEDFAGGQIIPKEEPKQENCCTPIGQVKRYKDCIGCDKKLSKLDLTQLSKDVDDALDKETKESMSQWLKEKREREEQETLEERAKNTTKKYVNEREKQTAYLEFIAGAQWQQEQFNNEPTHKYIDRHIVQSMVEFAKENKNSYTEEEVYSLLHNLMSSVSLGLLKINDDMDLKVWFNRNKKQ